MRSICHRIKIAKLSDVLIAGPSSVRANEKIVRISNGGAAILSRTRSNMTTRLN